jgi:hypothetical protein
MEREEMREEEIIEVKIGREVDKEISKEEEEGEEEEVVMITGREVRDNQAKIMIQTKMLIQVKIKIRMNKMHLGIQIKIQNMKTAEIITMIMTILERETHINKDSTVGIVRSKEGSVKMDSKKEVKNKKHHPTLTQIIENFM